MSSDLLLIWQERDALVDLSLLIRDLVFFLLIALGVILLTKRLALPYTLGLVVAGLLLGFFQLTPEAQLTPGLVLFIFLPALLFEGGWSVNFALLRENWRVIFFLAGPGLLLSLLIIAALLHGIEQLDWLTALLLAAILSPTDPVAVLGLFRQLRINAHLSTIVEGESLFNDGVAGSLYQTFLALLLLSTQTHDLNAWQVAGQGLWLFVQETGGGLLLGCAGGFLVSQGLKRLHDHTQETTVTLIAAYGIYWLADALHTSAIVAVIVAALILGNYGRKIGISEQSRDTVETFWEMLAFLANALIFLLVGVQIHALPLALLSGSAFSVWGVALFAIAVVLLARLALVFVLAIRSWLRLPRRTTLTDHATITVRQPLPRSWRLIIFWSGLRGALSLALVLALPDTLPSRQILLVSTYAVVLFTLLVQGFSMSRVLQHVLHPKELLPRQPEAPDESIIEVASTENER